jgi:hypothetical protein
VPWVALFVALTGAAATWAADPAAAPAVATPAAADEQGFVSLFDGTSLSGWEGKPEFWSVKDGAIVGETTAANPTKGNTFLIWRQGLVDDFELRLRYRLSGGNSGVQYRSKDLGDFVVGGYQGDFESGTKYSGILYEEKGRGILAERGQRITIDAEGKKVQGEPIGAAADLQKFIKLDDWNDVTIVAKGNKLCHFINGHLMTETTDEQAAKRAMEGVLALQVHAGPPMKLEVKDIRLKRLRLADGRKKIVLVAGKPSHGKGKNASTLPACRSSPRSTEAAGRPTRPPSTTPTRCSSSPTAAPATRC